MTYLVKIQRISYRTHVFEVEAHNKRVAKEKAMHAAYNHDFAEDTEDDTKYTVKYMSRRSKPLSNTGD